MPRGGGIRTRRELRAIAAQIKTGTFFAPPPPPILPRTPAEVQRVLGWTQRRLVRCRTRLDGLIGLVKEEQRLRERLVDLLTETANALKGEPGEDILHDWSDLPQVARLLREDLARLSGTP